MLAEAMGSSLKPIRDEVKATVFSEEDKKLTRGTYQYQLVQIRKITYKISFHCFNVHNYRVGNSHLAHSS